MLLEAAAHGVPAVAFDVSGGVRSAGPVLVPPGDVDAFGAELARLIGVGAGAAAPGRRRSGTEPRRSGSTTSWTAGSRCSHHIER